MLAGFLAIIISNVFCCRLLLVLPVCHMVKLNESVVCNIFFIVILYTTDMIAVLEVTPIVRSFPQGS